MGHTRSTQVHKPAQHSQKPRLGEYHVHDNLKRIGSNIPTIKMSIARTIYILLHACKIHLIISTISILASCVYCLCIFMSCCFNNSLDKIVYSEALTRGLSNIAMMFLNGFVQISVFESGRKQA